MNRSVLYLHGFASSPRSDKPVALARLLADDRLSIDAPDLNAPSFEWLSLEAMVARALDAARRNPTAAIVGSSLGSVVALEVLRHGVNAPVVLLAPAIGIGDLWISRCPDGDPITVWNHARGENAAIHRAFFERMSRFDAGQPALSVPVVIFMGTADESIPFEGVLAVWERWKAAGRLSRRSRFVAIEGGDHRLTAEIERISNEIRAMAAPRRQ